MSAFLKTTLHNLAIDHQWLGKDASKTDRLGQLLHEALAHGGKDAVRLVKELVERFVYVSNDEYDDYIVLIAEFLIENFNLSEVILCATTADRAKDSAQRVLYDTSTALAALGVYKPITINRYDRAVAAFKDDSSLREIVLIDEFVGTGRSLIGRVNNLKKRFSAAGINMPKVHFVGLAGMHFGLRNVESYLNSVNICIALKKGIREGSSQQAQSVDYHLMDLLEGHLSSSFAGVNLPQYGYGESEALYARKAGSCPNNVFPIFWWPQLVSTKIRKPLFPRSM